MPMVAEQCDWAVHLKIVKIVNPDIFFHNLEKLIPCHLAVFNQFSVYNTSLNKYS